MVKIKICGVRTEESAVACCDAGVDFVGFNFVDSSKRAINKARALALKPLLGSVDLVGVFQCLRAAPDEGLLQEIEEKARWVGLDYLQLHGNFSPDDCARLSEVRPVIKAFSVDEKFVSSRLEEFAPHVKYFLFDAAQPGSGQTFSWSKLKELPRLRPFFLAGGLRAENIKEAISAVNPDVVDTASGVERDGQIDADLIFEFCRKARRSQ